LKPVGSRGEANVVRRAHARRGDPLPRPTAHAPEPAPAPATAPIAAYEPSPAPQAPTAGDAERYAARERKDSTQMRYRGGDVIVISVSTLLIALLIVLIVLLLT
jgi:hypothetical protein